MVVDMMHRLDAYMKFVSLKDWCRVALQESFAVILRHIHLKLKAKCLDLEQWILRNDDLLFLQEQPCTSRRLHHCSMEPSNYFNHLPHGRSRIRKKDVYYLEWFWV